MQQANSFDAETLKKMGKSALISAFGAGLVVFLQSVGGMDFGQWTPVVTGLAAWGANTAKAYFQGA